MTGTTPTQGRTRLRRSGLVRAAHWINALAVIVLLMTGANIFNAHPRLYWGETGSAEERGGQWLEIGATGPARAPRGYLDVAGHRLDTTGVLGVSAGRAGAPVIVGFPGWATLPTQRDLAAARGWHFLFGWVIIVNGLLYLGHGLWSGHLAREIVPGRADASPRRLWHDIAAHARLRFPAGAAALRYGPLQKLAYAGVVLGLIPLVILTGMAMSPGLNAAFGFLPGLFGGRQSARSLHFVAANLILLFTAAHLVMVVLSGPAAQLRGMITGRVRV